MNNQHVLVRDAGRIGIITINNPPVNAMSPGVPGAIMQALSQMNSDAGIDAVVLTGGGKGNIAGADIRFQGKDWPTDEPTLRDLIIDLEASDKPVVAALGQNTLGGGLEIAMACAYRVIVAGGRVGQPEVTLGIPPGAGGTQRLPRLAPAGIALEMIVSGKPIDAAAALEAGIVDAVFADEVADRAAAFIADRVNQSEHTPTRERPLPHVGTDFFAAARHEAAARYRGLHAPQVCIDCVEAAFTMPFAEGLQYERARFEECVVSEEAAALRHVFFAERQAGKIASDKDVMPVEVSEIGVIGAGTMGSGISIALLKAGYGVRLIEASPEALQRGVDRITSTLDRDVSKGRFSDAQRELALKKLEPGQDMAGLEGVQLVIEAAYEDMAVKQEIFSRLGQVVPDAILASNTSYLDIDAIAGAAGEPASRNVLGMHFFSPANIMRLLEVVRGSQTSITALETALAVAKRAGKTAIIAGNCPGFIGNRLYSSYLRQANFLIEEGALPEQVDRALTEFGFAMGPFAVSDLAGLDIGWANRKANAANRDPSKRYSIVADRICERGWFGQKTGRGFYRYTDGSRRGVVDPAITDLILQASATLGIKRRQINDEEIVDRCVFAIINEGANEIEEGIAGRSSDIDLAWLYGYGFPRWRGGPMFYAGRLGLERVLRQIRAYDAEQDFWTPSRMLVDLVDRGQAGFD